MKRIVLLLAFTAVMVLVFASAAGAQSAATAQYAQYASPTATALAPTGGPSLGMPLALVAGLALVGSGLAALLFMRRSLE